MRKLHIKFEFFKIDWQMTSKLIFNFSFLFFFIKINLCMSIFQNLFKHIKWHSFKNGAAGRGHVLLMLCYAILSDYLLPRNSSFSPSIRPACFNSSSGVSLASITFWNVAIASSSILLLLCFSASLSKDRAFPYKARGLFGYFVKSCSKWSLAFSKFFCTNKCKIIQSNDKLLRVRIRSLVYLFF